MPEQTTPTDEQKPTHRLDSMRVHEVSFVDRAANRRTFLVTKKDESMANAVKKDGDTGTTPDAASPATADGANAAGDNAAATDNTAPAGSIQQQVKDALTSALAAVAEKLITIASEVDGLEVSDQASDPAVPESITAEIGEAMSMLSDVSSKFGGATGGDGTSTAADDGAGGAQAAGISDQNVDEGVGKANAPPPPTKGGDDKEEPTEQEKAAVAAAEEETEKKGLEVAKHADVVAKSVAARLSIPLEKASVVVAKVGRRMAKKRLEQLGKAVDMLISLMKELRYESEKSAKQAAEQAAIGKAATQPAIALSDVETVLTHAESLVTLAKSQEVERGRLQSALDAANAKVVELSKVAASSNAMPVERTTTTSKPVVWGLDMAPKSGSR